jgi:hypothetical protein
MKTLSDKDVQKALDEGKDLPSGDVVIDLDEKDKRSVKERQANATQNDPSEKPASTAAEDKEKGK